MCDEQVSLNPHSEQHDTISGTETRFQGQKQKLFRDGHTPTLDSDEDRRDSNRVLVVDKGLCLCRRKNRPNSPLYRHPTHHEKGTGEIERVESHT